ncbi:hypothetical protein AVEN_153146-1 [Araneus ventricosus]|uniref:Uncharacterized protein n=1 Tax=Araneus ventricosus TaxID=182803 RepID=A0A4Y2QIQ1_ARAVE|nr:hypothetical protein AVEN_153146-1 [Araneus ventricosus]
MSLELDADTAIEFQGLLLHKRSFLLEDPLFAFHFSSLESTFNIVQTSVLDQKPMRLHSAHLHGDSLHSIIWRELITWYLTSRFREKTSMVTEVS